MHNENKKKWKKTSGVAQQGISSGDYLTGCLVRKNTGAESVKCA
jgi:hypothetical protein